jgi:hypothetical protein
MQSLSFWMKSSHQKWSRFLTTRYRGCNGFEKTMETIMMSKSIF